MSESTETRVGVPGDARLENPNIEKPQSWFAKLPVVRDLKIAVGWQKGMLVTGLVLTGFFLLVAVFAPWIAPYGYAQIKGDDGVAFPTQAAPSREHIWGTTVGGFDVFSRTVWGARTAVIAIVVAVLLSIFAGVFLGLVSGYFGGWVDRVFVVIADAVYSFPSLLLAILMAIMISGGQSSLWGGILASGISITVVYIPQYFRTIRAEVIRIKDSAYIESAKVVGASTWRIMSKHLLKNSTRTLPVILTLNSSEAILTLAGLGFLARKSAGEVVGSIEDTSVDSPDSGPISQAVVEQEYAAIKDATEKPADLGEDVNEYLVTQDPETAVVNKDVPDESEGVIDNER